MSRRTARVDTAESGVPASRDVYLGKSHICCGRRCVTGPDYGPFIATNVLVVAPTAAFLALIAPELSKTATIIPALLVGWTFLVTMASLYKTSFTDPGILPRFHDIDVELSPTAGGLYLRQPPPKTILVRNANVNMRYCVTCRIYRPPRSSHCSTCDNCVAEFDHHCPWTGNCIGQYNYRYFLSFVSFVSILDLLVFIFSILNLVLVASSSGDDAGSATSPPGRSGFLDAIAASPVSGVLALYTFMMIFSVGGLSTYHCWLASINQTTHSDGHNRSYRPYTNGCWNNCLMKCCIPYASHVAFRDSEPKFASVDERAELIR